MTIFIKPNIHLHLKKQDKPTKLCFFFILKYLSSIFDKKKNQRNQFRKGNNQFQKSL